MQYSFTDLSTGSPTSWAWAFGDGNTSTLQNPSHIYAQPGNYTVTLVVTNACGSTSFDMLLGVVGIGNPIGSTSIQVFPNPSQGDATLVLVSEFETASTLEITDLHGKRVQAGTYQLAAGENRIRLDLTGVSTGMYLLNVTSPEGKWSAKLVKE